MYELDAATGAQLGTWNVEQGNSPTVVNGVVYVYDSFGGRLFALGLPAGDTAVAQKPSPNTAPPAGASNWPQYGFSADLTFYNPKDTKSQNGLRTEAQVEFSNRRRRSSSARSSWWNSLFRFSGRQRIRPECR
jgi:hypothetical protein